MKKLPVIIISLLAFLCAGAFVTFVIVFLTTRANGNLGALLRLPKKVSMNRAERGAVVRIPDRFKPVNETSAADSTAAGFTDSTTAVVFTPKYVGKYACRNKLDSDDMLLLIMGNNLFCKKSQWSKPWNNPGGKGIRSAAEGLRFADSTVVDSLTSIMWQRYSIFPSIIYGQVEEAIQHLNSVRWRGFDNWRTPTIEEIMLLLVPKRNRHGLYLPGNWNCNVKDIWSCNPACDSLSTQWIWVVRLAKGRCNYGHPAISRALLAVREMRGKGR
jgi:hypothetical protein